MAVGYSGWAEDAPTLSACTRKVWLSETASEVLRLNVCAQHTCSDAMFIQPARSQAFSCAMSIASSRFREHLKLLLDCYNIYNVSMEVI